MNPVISALHNDHYNFSRVIDALYVQVSCIQHQQTPDYSLMLDILDYIRSYPDEVHHPREDVIYAAALRYEGEHRSVIGSLIEEHQELKRLTEEVHAATTGVFNDETVDRDEYVETVCRFVERQRDHMNVEEGEVFPVLMQLLTEDDWGGGDDVIPLRPDPLFGREVLERYQSLYDHIVDSS